MYSALVVAAIILLIPNVGLQTERVAACRHSPERECYHEYYRGFGPDVSGALADIRLRKGVDPVVTRYCHELTHTIGHMAARSYPLAEAFNRGNSICRAGYYHGIMEALTADGSSTESVTQACTSLRDPQRQWCAHGVGHGLRALAPWAEAFAVCDIFKETQLEASCWSGVFMANSMLLGELPAEARSESNPHEPCSSLQPHAMHICYRYHILSLSGDPLSSAPRLFSFCREAPRYGHDSCFESIGHLWAVRNAHRVTEGHAWCAAGLPAERDICIVGLYKVSPTPGMFDPRITDWCARDGETAEATCLNNFTGFVDLE